MGRVAIQTALVVGRRKSPEEPKSLLRCNQRLRPLSVIVRRCQVPDEHSRMGKDAIQTALVAGRRKSPDEPKSRLRGTQRTRPLSIIVRRCRIPERLLVGACRSPHGRRSPPHFSKKMLHIGSDKDEAQPGGGSVSDDQRVERPAGQGRRGLTTYVSWKLRRVSVALKRCRIPERVVLEASRSLQETNSPPRKAGYVLSPIRPGGDPGPARRCGQRAPGSRSPRLTPQAVRKCWRLSVKLRRWCGPEQVTLRARRPTPSINSPSPDRREMTSVNKVSPSGAGFKGPTSPINLCRRRGICTLKRRLFGGISQGDSPVNPRSEIVSGLSQKSDGKLGCLRSKRAPGLVRGEASPRSKLCPRRLSVVLQRKRALEQVRRVTERSPPSSDSTPRLNAKVEVANGPTKTGGFSPLWRKASRVANGTTRRVKKRALSFDVSEYHSTHLLENENCASSSPGSPASERVEGPPNPKWRKGRMSPKTRARLISRRPNSELDIQIPETPVRQSDERRNGGSQAGCSLGYDKLMPGINGDECLGVPSSQPAQVSIGYVLVEQCVPDRTRAVTGPVKGGQVGTPCGLAGVAGTAVLYQCERCPRAFDSKTGLSLHMRCAHLEEYLAKPAAARQRGSVVLRDLWASFEIAKLTPMCQKMPTVEQCVEMAKALGTGKTTEQVRNKCRLLYGAICKRAQAGNSVPVLGPTPRRTPSTPGSPTTSQISVKEILDELRRETTRTSVWVGKSKVVPIPLKEEDCSQVAISSAASAVIKEIGQASKAGQSKGRRPLSDQTKNVERRRDRRRILRRILSRLYKKDRSKLAKFILDRQGGTTCPVPLTEVTAVFKQRWGEASSFHGLGRFDGCGLIDNLPFAKLILPSEVSCNLREIKSRSSPGPDGITQGVLLAWDQDGRKLAHMFSSWLVSGILPRVFKKCRTTLIPKTTDASQHGDINQWRPITISSIVLRLFSRILTGRMTVACPIHPHQRGFIASPGCSENLAILAGAMKLSKTEKRSLGVVFIDFAKAFDTISHEHLLSALSRKGLDHHMLGLLRNSYEACETKVGCLEGYTPDISMKVGVKQGDPMSPILFNLALDPLIQTLELEGRGFPTDRESITAIAFADDLAVLSDSWEGMVHNLAVLEEFSRLTGMKVQPRKCHAFFIQGNGKKYSVNNCVPWQLGGASIHMVGPDETVRYLGVGVNPWQGFSSEDWVAKSLEWVKAISKAPLDPMAKVKLLCDYAAPRMIFAADHCMLSAKVLTEVDKNIRRAVKSWLHLPRCTCDGLLYSRRRDGGLSLPKLARIVPAIQARRIHNLCRSSYGTVRWVAQRTVNPELFKRVWWRAGGSPEERPELISPEEGGSQGTNPATRRSVDRSPQSPDSVTPGRRLIPCDWRQVEFDRWAKMKSQGMGIHLFHKDKTSNCWLHNQSPHRLVPSMFSAALQLRANVYPTKELVGRGRWDQVDVLCRHCRGSPETCSHILGRCPGVRLSRIRRHHKLCELLATEAEGQGWKVEREKRWKLSHGRCLAPDLICYKAETALIVDVTVRYEFNSNSLEGARLEKECKYLPLKTLVKKKRSQIQEVLVFGFPLGARGKWPTGNEALLKKLGLGITRRQSFAELLSKRALLYSLDMMRTFMLDGGE